MLANDWSVQIKLIMMYAIGLISVISLLITFYIRHKKDFNKNAIIISAVAIIIAIILFIVLTL
ncbi:hypothetical protein [Apilactobacillus ozensis]|uniref:hypothetical protein n=1 Tax=Apilactobacillus ozensis TaxID=866801 RepID=UPI00200AB78B|nr:hypothetical protein [Apilactobacillus ozensis]MCK8607685.1 hypothetical protein [Apilactobacillus ozensis]